MNYPNLRELSKSLATPVERQYARYFDNMTLTLRNAEREQEKRRRSTSNTHILIEGIFPPEQGITQDKWLNLLNTQNIQVIIQ